MNIRHLLSQAGVDLTAFPESRLEAEILMCHVLGVSRAWLYANSDLTIQDEKKQRFAQWVKQRANGEPVAYITGTREFWSLPLHVTPDVLIPRPETELLVETALTLIPESIPLRIVDLGTGSGAVALSIASERPQCEVLATDISEAALAVARENSKRLELTHITFHHGSWLSAVTGSFHAVVSNPPYINRSDPHLEQGDCRFEPEVALTPGQDGLISIRVIATDAFSLLEKGGFLAVEHGYDQGPDCREFFRSLGYQDVRTAKDLAGLERVTSGLKP